MLSVLCVCVVVVCVFVLHICMYIIVYDIISCHVISYYFIVQHITCNLIICYYIIFVFFSEQRAASQCIVRGRMYSTKLSPALSIICYYIVLYHMLRPVPPTKSLGFEGFDSSRLLILRGGNSNARIILSGVSRKVRLEDS